MIKTSIALYILLVLCAAGCSKTAEVVPVIPVVGATKFPAPTWKADDTGKYPATMTAVVALPAAMVANITPGDKLAAFINGECRGVGVVDKVNSQDLFFVLVQGLPDETGKITFKYYNEKTAYMFEASSVINFLIDGVYGSAQNPKVLELKHLN